MRSPARPISSPQSTRRSWTRTCSSASSAKAFASPMATTAPAGSSCTRRAAAAITSTSAAPISSRKARSAWRSSRTWSACCQGRISSCSPPATRARRRSWRSSSARRSPRASGRSGDSAKARSCATCSRAPRSPAFGSSPAASRNAASTPSTSRCRSRPPRSEIGVRALFKSGSDPDLGLQQHFAEYLALLDEPERFVRLRERELLVDDRLELALGDEREQLLQIVAHEAVRAEHLDLEGPDVAQVFLGIEARGGAAGEHLAAPVHRFQRWHPGVAAGEVDHHIHAAFEFAPVRLRVLGVHPLHEI